MKTSIPSYGQTIDWLLNPADPGAVYLTLRNVLRLSDEDPALADARERAHSIGPIAEVLDYQNEIGYWEEPGPGYNPKYFSTVWSIILLAQLGAKVEMDVRIYKACQYYLDFAFTTHGTISTSGTPAGTADCLQGNMCWALTKLGVQDPRLDKAYEWMARTVTGEGLAPVGTKGTDLRYYAGKCGPLFACGANDRLPCAWGGVKVMQAFSALPQIRNTPIIDRAIKAGADFLLSFDPVTGEYPHPYAAKPSGNWWKFGFPVFYVTDLLQLAEAMVELGYGSDPRMSNLIQLIYDKQDTAGRWQLEYDYTGKMKVDFGVKKTPNKWVTIRALSVLTRINPPSPINEQSE